jgi:hypothetical protein
MSPYVRRKAQLGPVSATPTRLDENPYLSSSYTDEGRIATTPDILPPPYVLKLGQFYFEVPPADDVKPNFRTPPMVCHVRRGAAAKDI